eukprot:TRINITY_DN10352_c0_g1_i3.p1 TRINITY_DN10352_c0_g1~~TRINITY_DN10352_c0_g1_i3.p1  ORF type:complete len:366 (-),score=58.12 TRINITY_DN10352_c0_g1_i3:65-1162(-)
MGKGTSRPTSPWESAFGRSRPRILMTGIDAAGKTSLLYKIRLAEVVTTIPTIGFNVEIVDSEALRITCWDVGGKDKIRPLLRHYYQDVSAVIFVVDSCDSDRMDDARDELKKMLSESELAGIPLLVFANKQDVAFAQSASVLTEGLGLDSMRGRQWYIQACSSTLGIGIFEGLAWLAGCLATSPQTDPSALIALAPTPLPSVEHPGRYKVKARELSVWTRKPTRHCYAPHADAGTLPIGTIVDVIDVVIRSELGAALVELDAPLAGWCSTVPGDLEHDKASILTIRVNDAAGTLLCTNLAGDELAAFSASDLPTDCSMRDLVQLVAVQTGLDVACLNLCLPDGKLVSGADGAALVAAQLPLPAIH